MIRPKNVVVGLSLVAALVGHSAGGIAAEPKWESLIPAIDPAKQVIAGEWTKTGPELSVRAAQGARLALGTAPPGEYDLRTSFTRKTGQHSIGLVVVHGGCSCPSFCVNFDGQDCRSYAFHQAVRP